tara:strand:+ start:725 stop:1489 length:765 start_codon:yes stop_codon:yes gene_type:complete
MSNFKLNREDNNKNLFVTFATIATFITLVLLLLAVCGYRYNYFTVGYSLLFLTKYAVYVSIIALALSLISIGYSFKLYKKFINLVIGFFTLALNLTIISFFYYQILHLRSNPMINDISTDFHDLLEFKVYKAHDLPKDEHYFIQKYGGFKLPNYDIAPLLLSNVSKELVFNKSLLILKNMGLEITYENLEEGAIEAVEKSFWYGFKDDLIIRIEELISSNILINARSASRIGRSDFGKNSERIKSYFILLKSEL